MPHKNTIRKRHDRRRVREQIHDLSAGFRKVAETLGVPAGIGEERERERDEDFGDVPTEEDILGYFTERFDCTGFSESEAGENPEEVR